MFPKKLSKYFLFTFTILNLFYMPKLLAQHNIPLKLINNLDTILDVVVNIRVVAIPESIQEKGIFSISTTTQISAHQTSILEITAPHLTAEKIEVENDIISKLKQGKILIHLLKLTPTGAAENKFYEFPVELDEYNRIKLPLDKLEFVL